MRVQTNIANGEKARYTIATLSGRSQEAFEWMLEIDIATDIAQMMIPGMGPSGSFQQLDSKINSALMNVIEAIGGELLTEVKKTSQS